MRLHVSEQRERPGYSLAGPRRARAAHAPSPGRAGVPLSGDCLGARFDIPVHGGDEPPWREPVPHGADLAADRGAGVLELQGGGAGQHGDGNSLAGPVAAELARAGGVICSGVPIAVVPLLPGPGANTTDLSRVGSYEARTRVCLAAGVTGSGVSCRFAGPAGPGRAEQLRAERIPDPLLVRVRRPAALADQQVPRVRVVEGPEQVRGAGDVDARRE